MTDVTSSTAWTNWAGNERAQATEIRYPSTTDEIVAAVQAAGAHDETVKMMGTGHSFTAISAPRGVMLRPDLLSGAISVDRAAMTVTAAAGTKLKVLNAALAREGLSLHNMGDIAEQTLAGAVSTGTHGSGGSTAGLAAQLAGFQLVTGTGEVIDATADQHPEIFDLGRIGLGALGILTRVTFHVEPLFLLAADEHPLSWDELTTDFDALTARYDHVDAHWFPHTDGVLFKGNTRRGTELREARPLSDFRGWLDDEFLSNSVFGMTNRLINAVGATAPVINKLSTRALSARRYTDLAHRVFVSPRRVRFKEMEYALPREAGIAALREVRALIDRSNWRIGFPVEVRTAPADTVPLSTAYGRDTLYLAFHVHHKADHTAYFREVEAVLRAHAGRPHWGKMNTRSAADLAPEYPRFGDFTALRERLDPDRVFSNDYLRRVLGD